MLASRAQAVDEAAGIHEFSRGPHVGAVLLPHEEERAARLPLPAQDDVAAQREDVEVPVGEGKRPAALGHVPRPVPPALDPRPHLAVQEQVSLAGFEEFAQAVAASARREQLEVGLEREVRAEGIGAAEAEGERAAVDGGEDVAPVEGGPPAAGQRREVLPGFRFATVAGFDLEL